MGSLLCKNRETGFPYSFFGGFTEGNFSRAQTWFTAAELPLLVAQRNYARGLRVELSTRVDAWGSIVLFILRSR
jgi:hypothetical protein